MVTDDSCFVLDDQKRLKQTISSSRLDTYTQGLGLADVAQSRDKQKQLPRQSDNHQAADNRQLAVNATSSPAVSATSSPAVTATSSLAANATSSPVPAVAGSSINLDDGFKLEH